MQTNGVHTKFFLRYERSCYLLTNHKFSCNKPNFSSCENHFVIVTSIGILCCVACILSYVFWNSWFINGMVFFEFKIILHCYTNHHPLSTFHCTKCTLNFQDFRMMILRRNTVLTMIQFFTTNLTDLIIYNGPSIVHTNLV